MGFKKDTFIDCVGAVTILTEDRIVFQGQIVKDEGPRKNHEECDTPKIDVKVKAELEDEPEFIVLRLTCDPALIRDNANIQEIEPDLFQECDIIRISVDSIVAIGPSRECFGESAAVADNA